MIVWLFSWNLYIFVCIFIVIAFQKSLYNSNPSIFVCLINKLYVYLRNHKRWVKLLNIHFAIYRRRDTPLSALLSPFAPSGAPETFSPFLKKHDERRFMPRHQHITFLALTILYKCCTCVCVWLWVLLSAALSICLVKYKDASQWGFASSVYEETLSIHKMPRSEKGAKWAIKFVARRATRKNDGEAMKTR